MIKIEAIVRPDKMEDVKDALAMINVNGITLYQVMGCGSQRGYTKKVRGRSFQMNLIPKIKFEIVVSNEEWERITIDAICNAAYTGEPGDGKIFSYDLDNVVRIRTREIGLTAL
ncbi:MAG: P-II family nitrogen regulator [Eubacteriales bacterium]|nr:P-II family nitrogen regulator [Eubacteriales bacterium]